MMRKVIIVTGVMIIGFIIQSADAMQRQKRMFPRKDLLREKISQCANCHFLPIQSKPIEGMSKAELTHTLLLLHVSDPSFEKVKSRLNYLQLH